MKPEFIATDWAIVERSDVDEDVSKDVCTNCKSERLLISITFMSSGDTKKISNDDILHVIYNKLNKIKGR